MPIIKIRRKKRVDKIFNPFIFQFLMFFYCTGYIIF